MRPRISFIGAITPNLKGAVEAARGFGHSTTLNRQGNDRATSNRSAFFYTSDEQKKVAEDTIADVEASGLRPGKVVTELVPASEFWKAEPEHQDYLERYPNGYTCDYIGRTGNFHDVKARRHRRPKS